MKCVICGGLLEENKTDVFRIVNGRRVRILDVPIEVCSECGDTYIDNKEIEVIKDIMKKVKATDVKKVYFKNYQIEHPRAVNDK